MRPPTAERRAKRAALSVERSELTAGERTMKKINSIGERTSGSASRGIVCVVCVLFFLESGFNCLFFGWRV